DAAAGRDELRERVAERRLQRADIEHEPFRPSVGELAEHLGRDLDRRGDEDHVVREVALSPVVDARERQLARRRIGDLDRVALRREKLREPRAHLARTADNQHALAGAVRDRGDARLLLLLQRRANEEAHHLLDEVGTDTELLGTRSRRFQHLLLALIIARWNGVLYLVRADVGDDALPGGDQLDELAVHIRQALAQFFERHRVLREGSGVCTRAPARTQEKAQYADRYACPFAQRHRGGKAMSDLELVSEAKCFDGFQRTYRHASSSCGCPMQFAVFLPPAAERGRVPALYWLSGLTCTEENFSVKSGAQRYAAELGIALIIPDTSPRGLGLPGEDERIDVGTGAGFYVNATQAPWSAHYRMYDYISKELVEIV